MTTIHHPSAFEQDPLSSQTASIRDQAAVRDARSWLASGDYRVGPAPLPVTPTMPAAADSALPEFAQWYSSTIAQLGRDLLEADGSPETIGKISQRIDLAILDQLDNLRYGQVFTYKQQCFGELVQNLIPLRGKEQENSNAGRKAFPWHSDDARLDRWYRVDNLGLFGVDNRGEVPTRLLPVDAVVDRLDKRSLRHLCQPRYTQAVPQSYNIPGREGLRSPARPVLAKSNEGYHIRFTAYATRAVTGDHVAELALQALQEAVNSTPPKSIVLRGGDMLIFSNSRYLHSRGAVGGQRWIKRVYLKRDLSELARACSTDRAGVFDVEPAIRASSLPL